MTESVLALEVGHHIEQNWFGLTVNLDTVISTAIAGVIVIGLAFFLKAKVTSTGVPGGVQLFFEAITIQMRGQVESAIGMKVAPFVLPLAVALFCFILVANWLSVLPVQYTDSHGVTTELIKPPASDINFVLALALFVFLCYHLAGIWRRGIIGHPIKVAKGHVPFLAPINIVEEIASKFTRPHFIPDLTNHSQSRNLTRRLIERGFNDEQIEKILFRNWMRILENLT